MLLKCSGLDKKVICSKGNEKFSRSGKGMRVTASTGSIMSPRVHRKMIRIPLKRQPGKFVSMPRIGSGKSFSGKRLNLTRTVPAYCDNSNDSGIGFDQHLEVPYNQNTRLLSSNTRFLDHINESLSSYGNDNSIMDINNTVAISNPQKLLKKDLRQLSNTLPLKRYKMEQQIDIEDTCSNDAFTFLQNEQKTINLMSATKLVATSILRNGTRSVARQQNRNVSFQPHISTVTSKDGKVQLQILSQPEQQHRARYQTEGSRGAVKDRSGNGFPIVKLFGYNKPAVLEIFIGTDVGRVAPHMFYQACKVSGKNSTPCIEKKLEGTIIIEIELKPDTEMNITCDCVGILKERNVDVEHRFPDQAEPRSKKKSTRCRMVFRTQLTHDDGSLETLQICSHQIICTQPPGVPEICKKSLTSCSAVGGVELFLIGKNFLKDTRVVFQATNSTSQTSTDDFEVTWEDSVLPDKEFLQQTHLVCTVPQYVNTEITKNVSAQLFVISSNKKSESHTFIFTPKISDDYRMFTQNATMGVVPSSLSNNNQGARFKTELSTACPLMTWTPTKKTFDISDSGIMPPPSSLLHNVHRKSSGNNLISNQQQIAQPVLKSDQLNETSIPDANLHNSIESNILSCSSNENSMEGFSSPKYVQPQIREKSIDILSDQNQPILIDNNPEHILIQDSNMNRFSTDTDHENLNLLHSDRSSEIHEFRIKQEQEIATQLQIFVNNNKAADAQQICLSLDSSSVDNTVTIPYSTNQHTNSTLFLKNINKLNNQLNSITHPTVDQNLNQHSIINDSCDNILNYTSMVQLDINSVKQDVILNSQPSASINSPLSIITNNSSNSSQLSMSSDNILNPTVSPTIMCQNTTDSNQMLPTQVTSMLMQNQVGQNAILNNINSPILSAQNDGSIHLPHSSPVAVKNMILNAAADILSSQPSTIAAETTINSLISLNSTSMSGKESIINSEQQPILPQQLGNIFSTEPTILPIEQILPPQSVSMVKRQQICSDIQSNRLTREQNDLLNDFQNTVTQQETELLVRSTGDIIKKNEYVDQEANNINTDLHQQQQLPSSGTTNIPAEITIMSDNDLISYINPSCFDQV